MIAAVLRYALALGADDADTPFMGGSTADTPTTPESLRASDAERDHAVSELRDEFAEGRLSPPTLIADDAGMFVVVGGGSVDECSCGHKFDWSAS